MRMSGNGVEYTMLRSNRVLRALACATCAWSNERVGVRTCLSQETGTKLRSFHSYWNYKVIDSSSFEIESGARVIVTLNDKKAEKLRNSNLKRRIHSGTDEVCIWTFDTHCRCYLFLVRRYVTSYRYRVVLVTILRRIPFAFLCRSLDVFLFLELQFTCYLFACYCGSRIFAGLWKIGRARIKRESIWNT